MTARSVCIVPSCRNSSAKWAGGGYICGPHWRGVPKATRAEHGRLRRAWARAPHDARKAARQAFYCHWHDECVRAAVEAAAGLS